MRDQGLQLAIRAAGGISALARRIGVAQPSVSSWTKVPAERVVAVEGVTSVPRSLLRPDLYPEPTSDLQAPDAIDEARARLYLLLANLIHHVPDETIVVELAGLAGVADEGALGPALAALGQAAGETDAGRVAREHFELFIGVGRGELLPYASYYLTGFLYERPLVRVRGDMKRLGIARGEGMSEPEDHIGYLLETMAGLAGRRFAAEAGEERRFFSRHLAPWAERFFEDLARAEAARFYRAVGRLGAEFIRLEREAFALDDHQDSPAAAGTIEGARA
jgi:TorA maturation chaperone TorD